MTLWYDAEEDCLISNEYEEDDQGGVKIPMDGHQRTDLLHSAIPQILEAHEESSVKIHPKDLLIREE